MYELSCPECGKVTRWSFIRVGAVRVCAECRHTFQIDKEHVRRRVQIGVGTGGLDDDADNVVRSSLGMNQEDTALMGQPAIREEDLIADVGPDASGEQVLAFSNAGPSMATSAGVSPEAEAESPPRTPGIVLWVGIAMMGLGVLLLLLWLVGADADDPSPRQAVYPHVRLPVRSTGAGKPAEPGARDENRQPSPTQQFGELFATPAGPGVADK